MSTDNRALLQISGGVATFNQNIVLSAKNLATDTITGSRIGTATTQKLGFYNASPIVQPNGTGTTSGFTSGAGSAVDSAATFTGNTGSTAYTISDIVRRSRR